MAEVPVERRSHDVLDLTGVLEHDAHQRVDRRQVGFVLEAEVLCEARLLIERHAIGSSPTFEVQDAANPLEELVGLVDGLAFGDAQQAELLERRSERDLEPREELHVAQPARTLLHVGFEQGRRGTEALVTRFGVGYKRAGERVRLAPYELHDGAPRLIPRRKVARQRTAVEHRRSRIEAFRCERDTLVRRTDAVTDGQTGVPQRIQDAFGERRDLLRSRTVVQDQ